MIFLLPAVAAAAVTVGEAVGIGATLIGVSAGIKGAIDYRRAKQLKAEADAEYQEMTARINRSTARLKKSSTALAG